RFLQGCRGGGAVEDGGADAVPRADLGEAAGDPTGAAPVVDQLDVPAAVRAEAGYGDGRGGAVRRHVDGQDHLRRRLRVFVRARGPGVGRDDGVAVLALPHPEALAAEGLVVHRRALGDDGVDVEADAERRVDGVPDGRVVEVGAFLGGPLVEREPRVFAGHASVTQPRPDL